MAKLTDNQQQVLTAVMQGSYRQTKSIQGLSKVYETDGGLEFSWRNGLGDGKEIWIQKEKQPESFAKRVRKYVDQWNQLEL